MLRTDIVLLKPRLGQENELFRLAKIISLLWKPANYQKRQAFFRHQKMLTYNKQAYTFKHTEHFKAIGARNAQSQLKKSNASWKSFWELKMLQSVGRLPSHTVKVSPPTYWKDRKTNQKLHNFWSHSYIIARIKELGEECNIEITEQSERGTSKTRCICGRKHNGRIHRGLYYCKEYNIVINADVGGAYNLYNVAVNGSLCHAGKKSSGSRRLAEPLMLRRRYHRWDLTTMWDVKSHE